MKVLVVADKGNQIKIEKYIQSYKTFFRHAKSV